VLKTKILSLTLALYVSLACIPAHSADPIEITSLDNRIETPAYSVLPPQEPGWSYFRETPIKLYFGRIGEKDGQSFTGMIVVSRSPHVKSAGEFLNAVSKQRARGSDDPRYQDLINDETVDIEAGLYTVRFHSKYKDFGAVNLPDATDYLIVEDFGAVIRHPTNQTVAVTIALSQRSKEDDLSPNLKVLAEQFISSMELKDFEE